MKNKLFHSKKEVLVLIFLSILLFCLQYNWIKNGFFFERDQALNLLVAENINQLRQLPLVGPQHSVPEFKIPPSYFYVLSLFHFIGKTPKNTTLLMSFLNIASLVIFYKVVKNFLEKSTAIIATTMYSLSAIVISFGSYLWQPHPSIFFLLLALLFTSRKNVFLANVFFAISVSIHPSAILLYFYFFPSIFSEFKKTSNRILYSLKITIPWLILYAPLIIFEFTRKQFTAQAIINGKITSTNFVQFFMNVKENLFHASQVLFPLNQSNEILVHKTFIVIIFLTLHIYAFRSKQKFIKKSSIYSIISVLIISYVYKNSSQIHTLYPFIIPNIILLSFFIKNQASSKKLPKILVSILMVILFLYTNTNQYLGRVKTTPTSIYKNKVAAINQIKLYIKNYKIDVNQITFLPIKPTLIPNNMSDTIDFSPAFTYLFNKNIVNQIPLTNEGGYYFPEKKELSTPYAIILCQDFTNIYLDDCLSEIPTSYSLVHSQSTLPTTSWYVYRKIDQYH